MARLGSLPLVGVVVGAGPGGGAGGTGGGTGGTGTGSGVTGTAGRSFLSGHGAPAPSLGNDLDTYEDLDTGDEYTKAAGAWTKQGNLRGPQGLPGSPSPIYAYRGNWLANTAYALGDAVTEGGLTYVAPAAIAAAAAFDAAPWAQASLTGGAAAAGPAFYQTSGAPPGTLGSDGDSAEDTSPAGLGDLYKKASGAWTLVANLRGPAGAAGGAGPAGAAGQGFTDRGAWAPNVLYHPYDIVTNAGSTYLAGTSFTSGASFNPADWTLWAAAGAAGAPGGPGPAGATGLTGAAGNSVRFVSGTPPNGLGADGDGAIDTVSGVVYVRTGGSYTQTGTLYPASQTVTATAVSLLAVTPNNNFIKIAAPAGATLTATNDVPGGDGTLTLPAQAAASPYSRPALSAFTQVNTAGATVTDIAGGPLVLSTPPTASAYNVRILGLAPPSAPWTVTALIETMGQSSDYYYTGLIAYNAATLASSVVGPVANGGSPWVGAINWTAAANATSSGVSGQQIVQMPFAGRVWSRIVNDGTNLTYLIGLTGFDWFQIAQQPVSAGGSPDRIGVFACAGAFNGATGACLAGLINWEVLGTASPSAAAAAARL